MKATFRYRVKLLTIALACGFVLASMSQSPSQDLMIVTSPVKSGSFRLLSHELTNKKFPPYPFDPYGGTMPIYEMKGFPGKYFVADSPEAYQELKAKRESSNALRMSTLNAEESSILGEGGVAYSQILFTNAPETVLFDTLSSSSNGVLPSWRDVRTSPVPDGMAFGILIATNCPFEITKIEAEVMFDNIGSLGDTEFEVGFFRNTNQFQFGMYVEPEFIASDVWGTLSKTLTDIGNGRWLLSVELPTYGWGTNRVVTIRTAPNSSGAMAQMNFVACSAIVPGVTAYSSDNTTTNMTQASLPKMRVWRRMLSTTRALTYSKFGSDINMTWLPGYQLGISTNLNLSWDWRTDEINNQRVIVDIREGAKFFITRPDPTE